MASTTSSGQVSRPEVLPLPAKRGEIGYVESPYGQEQATGRSHSPEIVLPARHPADRDGPPTANDISMLSTPNPSNNFMSPSFSTLPSATNESTVKKKHLLGFLQSEKVPTFGGIRLTALLLLLFQILLIAATIVGWVLTVQHFSQIRKDSDNSAPPSTIIFHIIFVMLLVSQLLLFERHIFRLRAERYSFLHGGEILPTSRNVRRGDPVIAFAPWNRPPLPTYAATLAQSGVGTGDVEDHLIAVPPPPAYGNTRGSTMLLTGYLRESLRAQRPMSEHSRVSVRDERPMSYVSEDQRWEEIQNAERAQRLEETLAQLERPGSHS